MKPIPEMTDAEMNEAMAVEVRGQSSYWNGYKRGKDDKYFWLRKKEDWNPTSDLNQATVYAARNANPARAICEAVLMAIRSER